MTRRHWRHWRPLGVLAVKNGRSPPAGSCAAEAAERAAGLLARELLGLLLGDAALGDGRPEAAQGLLSEHVEDLLLGDAARLERLEEAALLLGELAQPTRGEAREVGEGFHQLAAIGSALLALGRGCAGRRLRVGA